MTMRLFSIGVTGLCCAMLTSQLGCKPRGAPSPGADAGRLSDTLPVDAIERSGAICDRLISSGVAKNCDHARRPPPSKLRGPVAWISTFEPVGGFPKDKCTVRVDFDDGEFKGFSETMALANIPADDYPRAVVFSAPAAIWHSTVTCDAGVEKGNKWDVCREKKPVDACAKAFPAEYAKYRALHDAATRIIGG